MTGLESPLQTLTDWAKYRLGSDESPHMGAPHAWAYKCRAQS